MIAVQERLETERITHAIDTSEVHKENYGQYFTPYPIAQFMASLFPVTNKDINLLDPGAGIGVLTCAFLERMKNEKWNVKNVNITAYDIDASLHDTLKENISLAATSFKNSNIEVLNADFLDKSSFDFLWKINKKDFVRSVAGAVEKNGRGGVCKSRPELLFPENGSCHLSITLRKTGCSKIVLAMSETPIAFG